MERINSYNRKRLLALPVRNWDESSEYNSILLCPTGSKHDSGYALIAVIGCRDQSPVEIAAYCDDVCWKIMQGAKRYGPLDVYSMWNLRTDMIFPAGVSHVWGPKRFVVKASLSSTDIEVYES